MAEPKQARVIADLNHLAQGALVALQIEGHPDLILQGGKYIIINTGLSNEEGKIIKRAYSLFAVKPETQQFFLAAESVPGGIASQYLKDLQVDDRITFSGPWGRYFWPADAQEKRLLALAFGSGITVILGYLSSVPEDCEVHLHWFKDGELSLLSDSIIQECAAHKKLSIVERNFQEEPTRDLCDWLDNDTRFIVAGEGTRADRCLAYLRAGGIPEDRLQSEIFYRQPLD